MVNEKQGEKMDENQGEKVDEKQGEMVNEKQVERPILYFRRRTKKQGEQPQPEQA